MQAETPQSSIIHAGDYKPNAPWNDYTMLELGQWVHLFSKRAAHRLCPDKREKDLTDAQNYLDMMQAKLNGLKNYLND